VITITGLVDHDHGLGHHDQAGWLITMTGIRTYSGMTGYDGIRVNFLTASR